MLSQRYIDSNTHSFHDYYILGEKLGEGQHASVYKCFKRKISRKQNVFSDQNLDDFISDEYHSQPFAVKVVRDDDNQKILAH